MNLLNQLPLPQRSVLLLHFVEDFSLEEIARITETQLGTVKSRMHYAKRALRKLLEGIEKMKPENCTQRRRERRGSRRRKILCSPASLRVLRASALKNFFMKMPREILFTHHQAAVPRLDAIRCEVVTELNNQATKQPRKRANFVSWLLCCSDKFWLELVWPCRRIWTGLAAIWILIFIVNVSQYDGSQTVIAKSAPSAGVMMTFRDQQKLLDELLADRSLPVDAERPKIYLPKPRRKWIF